MAGRIIKHNLKTGIKPDPEFDKKGLATHSLNVGLLCGHRCAYCSTPSLVRRHTVSRSAAQPPSNARMPWSIRTSPSWFARRR